MRRRPDEDRNRSSTPSDSLESFLGGLLRRHPRLPAVIGGVLLLLIIAGLLMALLSG